MKKKAFHFCGKALAVSLTALAAAFSFASCSDDDDEKENNKEEQEQIVPTKEVTFNLHLAEWSVVPGEIYDNPKILNAQYMDSLMTQPDVKTVTLKLAGPWDIAGQENMHGARVALEKIANIAPEKFKGEGDFVKRGLPRGTMSGTEQAVSDSLWFTSVGFTFLGQQ